MAPNHAAILSYWWGGGWKRVHQGHEGTPTTVPTCQRHLPPVSVAPSTVSKEWSKVDFHPKRIKETQVSPLSSVALSDGRGLPRVITVSTDRAGRKHALSPTPRRHPTWGR